MDNNSVETLPVALEIEVKGEDVVSNADEFRAMVRTWIEGFNTELIEDEDFARAEQDVKRLKEAESEIKAAKERALEQAEQVNALFAVLDETSEAVRQARLPLERQIKARREEIKAEIIDEAAASVPGGHGETYRREITDAIKNKRTIKSMREAAGVVVTAANALIKANTEVLDAFAKEHGRELIPDRRQIETKSAEWVEVELQRRLEAKAAEEERRKAEEERRKAEEERRRLEAETRAAGEEEEDEPSRPVHLEYYAPPDPDEILQAAPAAPDERQDLDTFIAVVRGAFGPVKDARLRLVHPASRAKADTFADALNDAWRALTA